MKKILTLIIFLGVCQLVDGQGYNNHNSFYYFPKRPAQSFFGSDSEQLKKTLYEYLYRHHYNAEWIRTDTSIELAITHDSAAWVIYSAFYFDSTQKCYAFTNERCDSFGMPQLKRFLTKSIYNWHKIDENKYLSDFEYGELLEVQIDNDCVAFRRTKLNLTGKQYRQLKKAKKDN